MGREGRGGIGLWTGPHQVWKEIDAYAVEYCSGIINAIDF
jgi:hypothetical protein